MYLEGLGIGIGMAVTIGLLLVVIVQRLSELVIAARNRRWALARGGREVAEPQYWMFFALHTGWLIATFLEARGPQSWFDLGLIGYLLIQVLRYWAIGTLGRRWNTRIIVMPGKPPVSTGPYRWMRHPNYIAVVLELALVPMMLGAWFTAAVATVLNAVILLRYRIPAEEQALREAQYENSPSEGDRL